MSRDIARRYEDFDLDMEANTAFPSKLFLMLENNADTEVIGWLGNGLSFAIFDQARFADLLPQYFKHKKISSFQRQLNLYGFRRDKQQSSYFHPKFQRGRRDLLSSIKRLPNKGSQKQESGMYMDTVMKEGESGYFPPRINLRARPDGGARDGTDPSGRVLRKLPNTWMNVHHHVTGAQGAAVKRSLEDESDREEDIPGHRTRTGSGDESQDGDSKDTQAKARADRSAERAEKKAKQEADFSFARITNGDTYAYSIKNPIKRIPLVSESEGSTNGALASSSAGSLMVTKKSKVTANIGYYEMVRTGNFPTGDSDDGTDGQTPQVNAAGHGQDDLAEMGEDGHTEAFRLSMLTTSEHSDAFDELSSGASGSEGGFQGKEPLSLDALAQM